MSHPEEKADLLSSLNSVPPKLRHIHLLGICGTGMASLAGMLKEMGYRVTGSDQNVYPPMSLFLKDLSIPIQEGYRAQNLSPNPDLVIVGNVITKFNPEAVELSRLGLPYISFPQALSHFVIRDKRSIVISGTHGKTTTCAILAWILEKSGMDPGFMIGGIPLNFQKNFKLGKGPFFVIEGDEYDTAFFDKGPKFLHYRPYAVIITGIEYDHADIYPDLDHIIANFRKLIDLIPPDGYLIVNGDNHILRDEIRRAKCDIATYGLSKKNDFHIAHISVGQTQTEIKVLKHGKRYLNLSTSLYGRHNVLNILSTVVMADFLNIPTPIISESHTDFKGIKRRQEIVGEKNGIIILDDFAHHPTAVKETIQAVRHRYDGRRLIAVFEPRSNSSRRNVFQAKYADAFDEAHVVMIPEPPLMEKIPVKERFSSKRLVADLMEKGIDARYFPNTDLLLEALTNEARTGDVILIMSNGAFDNLHQRLLQNL